ncbi:DUF3854 domain-containing protein [Anaeromyxobacter oryzae]|uniref:DUF3854 domain-containing protein n=1 Tax=Anaeromyxobacter oryzae TaxID=2918170 RepID=A0ABN6MYY9_9BACT|nr:DUF3854 domain-containing protein [Anaeromyxobacter oryzae]BDG04987.1 hypothetical protein AMOR_39830 [Anaeromyxobacter oryzae]
MTASSTIVRAQPDLQTLARKKWESSGLAEKHAKRMRLRAMTGQQVADKGITPAMAGLLIPYFDEHGTPTKFCRVRFLDEARTGFLAQATKPQRFAQPAGTLNEVYMPPLLDGPWAEVLTDPNVDLIITEGEFKAACACAHGLPTLGLGGVDVWRSKSRGLHMLPTLAHAEWANRRVTIIYDSDLATNPDVLRAQNQLARALLDRGARVRVATVTPAEGGGKQGLDDLIVAHGPEAVAALVESATAPDEALALHEMNADVVYVFDPGVIVVQRKRKVISPDAFATHAYANRRFERHLGEVNGVAKTKEVSTARAWLEWGHRNEFDRLIYAPGQPLAIERIGHRGESERCFNMWQGWGVEPRAGDVRPWHRLLDHVFTGASREHRVWFERWCAYPMQHPGTKLFTSVLFWGVVQGIGKSFTGDLLRDVYGKGTNAILVNTDTLESAFNGLLANRQFVHGDEITGNNNRKHADKLKNVVVQEQMTVNEKFVPAYEIDTCANYFFTSNHPDAFFLEDADRRFFIHEVTAGKLPSEFVQDLRAWRFGGGPAALFQYLLNLDLGDFDPRAAAPMTAAKLEMVRDSKSDVGRWVQDLRIADDAEEPSALTNSCDLLTSTEVLNAYDPMDSGRVTEGRIGIELKKARFERRFLRIGERTERLWAVRNRKKWAAASDREWVAHRKAALTAKPKRKF